MNNFDIKKKIISSGNSKIFNNWHEVAEISENEFLEALKWVCEDPCDDNNYETRSMGLVVTEDTKNRQIVKSNPEQAKMLSLTYNPENIRGSIKKLTRHYDNATGKVEFFDKETNKSWEGNIILSCRDRV